MWLKIDHTHFDGVEDAKKMFSLHVQRGFQPLVKLRRGDEIDLNRLTKKPRYIDTLTNRDHVVFVAHKNYKSFGNFEGTNDKGSALVTFEGKRKQEAFTADLVISM